MQNFEEHTRKATEGKKNETEESEERKRAHKKTPESGLRKL